MFQCLKETCCFCFRRCTESYTRLSGNEDRSDDVDPEIEQFRNTMHEVFNSLLEDFADLQRGTEAQRRNALRNLQKRHPPKEYSDGNLLYISIYTFFMLDFF